MDGYRLPYRVGASSYHGRCRGNTVQCEESGVTALAVALSEKYFAFCGSGSKYVNLVPRAHIASPVGALNPEMYKELHVAVESVLEAALPALGRMNKPALLLPGKLQAVVKAQRIYMQPGSDYSGCWHYDGKKEDIVAVVLYYYRFTEDI